MRDQRIRFLAVGATNTVVGYLIFATLTHWVFAGIFLGYLISLALSYIGSITLAFALYRRFVFVVSGRLVGDFVRFVSVYLVAIGVNALVLPVLIELVGIPPLLAQAMILIATTGLSFFGHKNYSFRRDVTGSRGPESQEGGERSKPG